jgi:hypothetical protein
MLVQARGKTFDSPKELLEAAGVFDLTQQNITNFLVRPEPIASAQPLYFKAQTCLGGLTEVTGGVDGRRSTV